MNRTRPLCPIRRLAGLLAALATALLAAATAATAAFAEPLPPKGGGGAVATTLPPEPPGWNKHPPLPARHVTASAHQVHTVVMGGMPGWQIALIAIAAAVVAATAAVFLDRARGARRHQAAPSA